MFKNNIKMFSSSFCIVITVFCLIYVHAVLLTNKISADDYNADIYQWFFAVNEELREFNREGASLAWTMMTEEVNDTLMERGATLGAIKTIWKNDMCRKKIDENKLNKEQNRMYKLLCRGPKYTAEQARRISKIMENLSDAYASAEICVSENSWPTKGLKLKSHDGSVCLKGEPDLEKLMTNQNLSINHLYWVWKQWHDTVGPRVKPFYPQLVNELNLAAESSGYEDIGEVWREELEIPDLEKVVNELYYEIYPLYQKLHAVIRYKLFEKYGANIIDLYGPIPAHLLGNMWGQDWSPLIKLFTPEVEDLKLNERIENKNWTVHDMVINAEDMYASLGLPRMTEQFWKYSKFEKDNESESQCHGTAANMFTDNDYRILLCASLNMDDFYVIHHEMGHIQYYMAYSQQPPLFQDGTSSAFQESIGDSIMIGVMTPQHLHRLGLITDQQLFDKNTDIALLLQQALIKLPQIPFALLIDKYRWDIFKGRITPDVYNSAFWKMSQDLRGIVPPVARGEKYFDAGSKFHIPDNTPYIRYFLASILQVEMFKGMCELTLYGKLLDNRDRKIPFPLHKCDIYGSRKAGTELMNMMRIGASEHWTNALKILTGKNYISVKPLLDYYEPVKQWLEDYISTNNIPVGW